jgi:Leucine-rich repeat (LRR) protein/predicted nucleic-acid-binding Zn-ribbon protein
MRSKMLIFLLLVATASAQSSETARSQLKCEETAACTCFDYNEIEIQCPKFEPHVIFRIQPNNFVHFECENMTGNEYELVPEYELDLAAFLQITKCTLLEGKSIMESYLKKIKINRIRSFQFVSSGANKHVDFQTHHFRGLGNIERFDLRGMEDEIKQLPKDFFTEMKMLSWVRIRVAKIHLPQELFAPLENLEFLELGHNKLESLPPGFLRNQRKLVQLNLWGNSLKNLNKDSFVGLDLVKELDLSANGMESLESDLLYHLTNLTDINLSANNFTSLPDGLFQNNGKLKFVRLLENRVQLNTLPRRFFANLPALTQIYLKADLQTLPDDVFEGSKNISMLKLDQNLLYNLPENLFKDQESLERLYLQDNRIDDLPNNFFVGTKSLRELNLSRNRLTIIKK